MESHPLLPHTQENIPSPKSKWKKGSSLLLLSSLLLELLYESLWKNNSLHSSSFSSSFLLFTFLKCISTFFFISFSSLLFYIFAILSHVSFLLVLCSSSYKIDMMAILPFSLLHITLPLLLTTFQIIMLRSIRNSNQNARRFENTTSSSSLTFPTLLLLMKPYFWPHGISHRVRALSTFLFLGISKTANLISPLYMGKATNAILSNDASDAIWYLGIFCILVFVSKGFKEMQSVVYLRVKQTAYIEIAEMTYIHLHSLSLDWHLTKRMGDVLRSMDRGVESANQVVSYLFLYLIPTVVESVVVLFIFALHFQVAMLSLIGFIGLILYSLITIHITLW